MKHVVNIDVQYLNKTKKNIQIGSRKMRSFYLKAEINAWLPWQPKKVNELVCNFIRRIVHIRTLVWRMFSGHLNGSTERVNSRFTAYSPRKPVTTFFQCQSCRTKAFVNLVFSQVTINYYVQNTCANLRIP